MTELSEFICKKLALRLLSEICSIVSSIRLNANTKLFFSLRCFIKVVGILLGRKPACKGLNGSFKWVYPKLMNCMNSYRQFIFLMALKKTATDWLEGS